MTIRATFLCAALWTVAVAAATPPPPASDAFADIRSRIDSLAGIRSQPDGVKTGDMPPPPAGDGLEAQTEGESGGAAMPDAAENGDGAVLERSADSPTEEVGKEEECAGEAKDVDVLPAGQEDEAISASPEEGQPKNTDAGEDTGEGKKPAAEIGEAAAEGQPAGQATEEEPPPPTAPKTVRVVYPDMAQSAFHVEEWASELVESGAEEGEHVCNGWTLVVVKMAWSGSQTFRRLAAKRRAMDILREHHPELPSQFKASTRILADVQEDDGTFTFVQAFRL